MHTHARAPNLTHCKTSNSQRSEQNLSSLIYMEPDELKETEFWLARWTGWCSLLITFHFICKADMSRVLCCHEAFVMKFSQLECVISVLESWSNPHVENLMSSCSALTWMNCRILLLPSESCGFNCMLCGVNILSS